VFVVRDQKVEFVPLRIGVTGASNVEVLEGLEEGAEIVTGSYQVLRTIRPGTKVVVENNVSGT
jgi:HlyD family secretion protein